MVDFLKLHGKRGISNMLFKELDQVKLRRIHEEYYMEEGLRKGMEQGMEQGMKQGMKQGITQGMEQGMEQGMKKGMKKGMKQGMAQGREEVFALLEKGVSVAEARKMFGRKHEAPCRV
jgi:flagellar biosynthesis/type III secretory pathway protein FliH